jgi:hypothetical protein
MKTIIETIIRAAMALIVIGAGMYLTSCAPFQTQTTTAPNDAPSVDEDQIMTGCVAACTVFEFTVCSQAMQRSLGFGEMLTAAEEVVQEALSAYEELTAAQADCTAKCLTLADSLAHRDPPEELPLECLLGLASHSGDICDAVDECF